MKIALILHPSGDNVARASRELRLLSASRRLMEAALGTLGSLRPADDSNGASSFADLSASFC